MLMRSLKKALRSKVELWIVGVALALAVAGTAGFGAFIDHPGERGRRAADAIENLHRGLYGFLNTFAGIRPVQRFHGMDGLTLHGAASPAHTRKKEDREAGYLAVARSVPEERLFLRPARAAVVELVDLNQRKTIHTWKAISRAQFSFYVLPDGSLIINHSRSMFRMDPCSNVVWSKRLGTHHSIERDADGNFWTPYYVARKTVPHGGPDLREDGLLRISPDGEVLSRIALSDALMRAGHGHLLYGMWTFDRNPFHMNDVEPVLRDGPFWRRGDLFVSLRTNSAVLLYRPATDEVVWLRSGPWLHQHDVDVVSDTEISVFSNNAVRGGDHDTRVLGANEVYVYDFATDEARSPWREGMRRQEVRTRIRGSAAVFGDGGVMLEESAQGRILRLSADGAPVWSYVNRASDGSVYPVVESRHLDVEYGTGVARSIASVDCGAAAD